MKIFIALGSQKSQFNRLLREMDACIAELNFSDLEVFAQIGYSSYLPQRYAYSRFVTKEEYASCVLDADLLIVHGGAGTIMRGLEMGKRIIVYPRKACFKEHVDDHQNELALEFQKRGYVLVCDGGDLGEMIPKAMEYAYTPYRPQKSIVPDILSTFYEETAKVKG